MAVERAAVHRHAALIETSNNGKFEVKGPLAAEWLSPRRSVIGWVNSGGFGHRVGHSLALGYVPDAFKDATDFEIEILGAKRKAVRLAQAAYDASGSDMRT